MRFWRTFQGTFSAQCSLGATCGAKKKVLPSVLFISMRVLHGVLPAIFKEDRMTGIWDSAQNFMKALWFIGFMDAGVAVYLVYFGVSHMFFNVSQLFPRNEKPGFRA